MAVKRTLIISSRDPADTFPWCDSITFDPLTRQVSITGFNGLKDTTKQAAINGTRTLALTIGKSTERHAVIIANDGTLQFVAFSDLPRTCYAHLAFYDPVSQDVEVLSFVMAS